MHWSNLQRRINLGFSEDFIWGFGFHTVVSERVVSWFIFPLCKKWFPFQLQWVFLRLPFRSFKSVKFHVCISFWVFRAFHQLIVSKWYCNYLNEEFSELRLEHFEVLLHFDVLIKEFFWIFLDFWIFLLFFEVKLWFKLRNFRLELWELKLMFLNDGFFFCLVSFLSLNLLWLGLLKFISQDLLLFQWIFMLFC